MTELLLGGAAVLLASLVQGCTGFGFALVTVPVLLFFLPHTQVPPIVVMLSLLNNVIVAIESRREITPRLILPLIAGGLIGIPAGVYVLKVIDPAALGCWAPDLDNPYMASIVRRMLT